MTRTTGSEDTRRDDDDTTPRLTTDGGTPLEAPAAPTAFRTSVYSSTAAELFWTRPATPGLRYEVRRDGAPLAIVDGTSYFDDTLAGGTFHVYDVIAIDRGGRLSASADVTLTTFGDVAPPGGDDPFAEPDPDGTTTIARIGYPAVRDLVDELIATSYLALYHDIDLSPIGLAGGQGAGAEDIALDCPGGGRAA